METGPDPLEGKYRASLAVFSFAMVLRLIWWTVVGLAFLIHYLDRFSIPAVLLMLVSLYLQLLPCLFVVLSFLIFRFGAGTALTWRLAIPGLVIALGAVAFAGASPWAILFEKAKPSLNLLLSGPVVLILDSLACCLFCRLERKLVQGLKGEAGPESGKSLKTGESAVGQLTVARWDRTFRAFRNGMALQVILAALLYTPVVLANLPGTMWADHTPGYTLFLHVAERFFQIIAPYFILKYFLVTRFCIWALKTSGNWKRAVKTDLVSAGQLPPAPGWGRWLVWSVPGFLWLGALLLVGMQLLHIRLIPEWSPTLVGSVDQLKATVMVPAWDSRMPEGKTVIWCASFQEAWRRLGKDVNGEAVQLEGMPEVSAELGRWNPDKQVWQGTRMVAEVGTLADGVYDRIAQRMREEFPNVPPPAQATGGTVDVAVAFAYMEARLQFTRPYVDQVVDFPTGEPLKKKRVKAFGLPSGGSDILTPLRTQCVLLYDGWPERGELMDELVRDAEFCLDLDGDSQEVQVLVARVARPKSLREGWEVLVAKMEAYKKKVGPEKKTLDHGDSVAIPVMHWDLTAKFLNQQPKIRNGKLANYGIAEASQGIRFGLDKGGAEAKSMGQISGVASVLPKECTCDRPFLIVMKNRKASVPFLMVWVDNAEVLEGVRFWP